MRLSRFIKQNKKPRAKFCTLGTKIQRILKIAEKTFGILNQNLGGKPTFNTYFKVISESFSVFFSPRK